MKKKNPRNTAKYTLLFGAGVMTSLLSAYAAGTTTIETSISNAIQYIKQIVITSDGSQNGNIMASIGSGKTYFSGNVGIGTTNPKSKVNIAGNGEILRVEGGQNDSFTLTKFHFGVTESAFIMNYGYNYASPYRDALQIGSYRGGPVIFSNTRGTESMRVNGNGNVGIGTNSPTTKLDVNGTINATGYQINGKPGLDKCILYMDQSGIEQYMKYEKGILIDAGYGTSCP